MAAATQRQREYLHDLGGELWDHPGLTRDGAAQAIEKLRAARAGPVPTAPVPPAVPAPVPELVPASALPPNGDSCRSPEPPLSGLFVQIAAWVPVERVEVVTEAVKLARLGVPAGFSGGGGK